MRPRFKKILVLVNLGFKNMYKPRLSITEHQLLKPRGLLDLGFILFVIPTIELVIFYELINFFPDF